MEEEQVTGSGSSALRSYLSFVQPRPGKQHGPVDNALDLAANRAANQVCKNVCGGVNGCVSVWEVRVCLCVCR